MSDQGLIPVPKAAADYGIARSLIDEAIREKELVVHPVGRSKLLDRSQFESWIKKKAKGGPRAAAT